MENQNQSDNLNKELSSIENNPDTIQNEILNNIDTQNTQYTEEVIYNKYTKKDFDWQFIWHDLKPLPLS